MRSHPSAATAHQKAAAPAAGMPPSVTRHKQHLALLALAGMAVVWGYNWVVMKHVLLYVGPFSFSMLRSLFGALVLFAAMIVLRRSMRIRAWRRVVLLGLLQTGIFSALVQLALIQGGAGKTSILVYTMPFWVIPMAWIAFAERIHGLQWVALALAAAGLILVLEPWHLEGSILSDVLAVLAGLCWALSMIVAKWIKRDYPMDALPLTAWQMLFGALALAVAVWLIPERPIIYSGYFFWAVSYNAFLATALAWFLWLYALQYLSAGVTGMAALGVPIVGVLSGWLQLGEQPGAFEIGGMGLIALALIALSLQSAAQRGS